MSRATRGPVGILFDDDTWPLVERAAARAHMPVADWIRLQVTRMALIAEAAAQHDITTSEYVERVSVREARRSSRPPSGLHLVTKRTR